MKGILALSALVLSIVLYCLFPGFANVSQNSIPQGFMMFTLVSIMASLGLIGISRYIHGKVAWLFQLLGKNSLGIMCIHMTIYKH